jgi:hypothetical protein
MPETIRLYFAECRDEIKGDPVEMCKVGYYGGRELRDREGQIQRGNGYEFRMIRSVEVALPATFDRAQRHLAVHELKMLEKAVHAALWAKGCWLGMIRRDADHKPMTEVFRCSAEQAFEAARNLLPLWRSRNPAFQYVVLTH